MELREFAEKILHSSSLADKLAPPGSLTDESPGSGLPAPKEPVRPHGLTFQQEKTRFQLPSVEHLERDEVRGRLLHYFANHELLATELMALVLLKFPNAPKAFRSGVIQTLKEEQNHTRMYLRRLEQLGVHFGEYPVNGFFWKMISGVESPMDYVSRLSLTFEQANLDYSKFYADRFAIIGDEASHKLMQQIYEDEIGHVSYGLKWFRKWKSPDEDDWSAFESRLRLPLSANRAKAEPFNREGRQRAGLTEEFIDELFVYSKSKGRTPDVYIFNPFAESYLGRGRSFEPNKQQAALASDLEALPQFLCRRDDVVLVNRRPRTEFLVELKQAGFELPQFELLEEGALSASSELRDRKLGEFSPWAWSPESAALFEPLGNTPDADWLAGICPLYSKAWSAELLGELVDELKTPSWCCRRVHIGRRADSYEDALSQIAAIRARGHQRVVAKMLFGVAGNNMQRLWERELTESQHKWLRRTIEAEGGVLIEPWLERVFDFSFQFHMTTKRLRSVGMVEMLNDQRGQFQASVSRPKFGVGSDAALMSLLNGPTGGRLKSLHERLRVMLEPRLQAVGFRGALGIDAFAYRDGNRLRLKPITEMNARHTMGRVMLELMRHVASGRTGRMELVSPPMLKQRGHKSFADYAASLREESPVKLSGSPRAKIDSGSVCLNDPLAAKGCLAVLHVGRDS